MKRTLNGKGGIRVRNIRLIARLDIKAPNLIKGVRLEGLRVLGDPKAFATRYYEAGVDEIIYMDIVASLYERNSLGDLLTRTARDVFIPITVGGGVRSIDDVRALLRAGADKVAINTAAVRQPELISEVASRFGSQCMVLSIEAKSAGPGKWEAYTDNGRERTGLDVLEWVKRGCELGAGEILLTSVDREGTRKGFDVELLKAVAEVATCPVIASGGMGTLDHMRDALDEGGVDAIAMADVLHYDRLSLREIRAAATDAGYVLRQDVGAAT
ncbi:imidazole glycerol phosphate synthase cyclase subunit [uncultured Brevundimonas sp.]|uniref:imidazole glycerol phosphate synthase subunit HisF n=1 Tax=uncultured Brevundimonas sp. TaxID=213418 RepID=UPI002624C150|nr:imidazole glycerol phosphate synthase cyclase subunit [uncultured Brevundimonas sp.]